MTYARMRSSYSAIFFMAFLLPVLFSGCGTLLTKVAIFSVKVMVVDENDTPLAGAIVEVTDGQIATTGQDGVATVKFAAAGLHIITVMAQDRVPATLRVTMPLDIGKTLTARLGKPVEINASIHISGNITGNLMGLLTQIYPMMFQSLFAAHGYSLALSTMAAGEWTEWTTGDPDDPMIMRKAYLTKQENGQEWWQIKIDQENDDDDIVMEVLFSKGRQTIRRMRQQSGQEDPAEVPVTEGWYSAPMELTPESLEGAVKQRGVSVTVPAGEFKADLLEFAIIGGASKLQLWRVKNIPGGIVQAMTIDSDGEPIWVSQLKAHGKGAKTTLGSY